MVIVPVWFLCIIVGYFIGARKNEPGWALFMTVLFGPLGLLIVMLHGGNQKTCPYCKSKIHKDAVVCPKCQKVIPAIGTKK